MALKRYRSGDTDVYFKNMTARVNGRFVMVGIAFRTKDAPIGFMPFYDKDDFNCDGQTSLKERVLSKVTMGLSAAASPHTLLIQAAAADPDFAGAGEDSELADIQRVLRKDQFDYARSAAGGVFVEGIMIALGGPIIKTFVNQVVQSQVKQFLVSKAISGAAKSALKSQGVNTSHFMSTPP
jgi:hypothetical protein